jgi:hypothetical protein
MTSSAFQTYLHLTHLFQVTQVASEPSVAVRSGAGYREPMMHRSSASGRIAFVCFIAVSSVFANAWIRAVIFKADAAAIIGQQGGQFRFSHLLLPCRRGTLKTPASSGNTTSDRQCGELFIRLLIWTGHRHQQNGNKSTFPWHSDL